MGKMVVWVASFAHSETKVVSVVHSMDIFSLEVKKSVVSVVSAPSRDFLVLKHVLKTVDAEARSNGLNMANLSERKTEEDQTDSILWLGFNKFLKILIGNENMEALVEDATMKQLAAVAQLARCNRNFVVSLSHIS